MTDYTSLSALKERLGITDTNNDAELQRVVTSASRQIDAETEQTFGQQSEVRTFIPTGPQRLDLGAWSTLVSVTSLATDDDSDGTYETTWDASDYQLLTDDGTPNVNAAPVQKPYIHVHAVGDRKFPLPTGPRQDLVQIDGTWGWPQVPTVVEEACLIISAETFKLRDAPFGIAGFGEFGAVRVKENPKASKFLRRYIPLGVT